MAKQLSIIEKQLELGQVKTITSNSGKSVDYIELLFSPTTKAEFAPSEDKKNIMFSVSDNYLELPELSCNMDKDTLRNLILSLKNIYNELLKESEV